VSNTMLTYAESAAHALHVNSQCRFLHCSAERLDGLADSSVDVVTTRAAIAYVTDKSAALREFYRVLKPDGRLSMAEPLMQDDAFHARALRNRVEDPSRPVDRFLTLVHRWKSAQFPDTEEAAAKSPIASYSERDLLIMTRDAGFGEIHLQLHIDMLPAVAVPWSVFIGTTPHPWAPSLKEILAERFTAEEAQFFEETMRPRIESGKSTATGRVVYLQATR
jgi:arsenite methyltransferase